MTYRFESCPDYKNKLRGGVVVAFWAHNPLVAGSIPAPATNGPIVVEVAPKAMSG